MNTTKEQPSIIEALGYLIGALIILGLALSAFCLFVFAIFGGFGPIGVIVAVLMLFLL